MLEHYNDRQYSSMIQLPNILEKEKDVVYAMKNLRDSRQVNCSAYQYSLFFLPDQREILHQIDFFPIRADEHFLR